MLQLSTIKLCKSVHATTRTYFERRFMTHGHFYMGYSESTFSKYSFGRGSQKSTLCTLVKMMTIMDDPLGRYPPIAGNLTLTYVETLITWPYTAGGRSRRGSPKTGTTVDHFAQDTPCIGPSYISHYHLSRHSSSCPWGSCTTNVPILDLNFVASLCILDIKG